MKSSAEMQAPVMESNAGEVELKKAQTETLLTWQDDWVVYGEDIYEYNDDMINLLLLGIDRTGELDDETDLSDWNAGQADAIFLVALNNEEKNISIIGIPRNSMTNIDIYGENGDITDTIYNQLCLQYGYAGGGELGLSKTKEKVSELLYQLPIHGACAVNLDAISIVVDAIGGVDVTVPEDLTNLNWQYTQGAEVTITGKMAKQYLRYRDTTVLGSPTTRLQRQKEFLQSAVSKCFAELKSNPLLVSDIYQAIVPYMNTDITLDETIYLTAQAAGYGISSVAFYNLTGEDKQINYINQNGNEDFYDDYYLDEDALRQIVITVFYHQVVIDSAEP